MSHNVTTETKKNLLVEQIADKVFHLGIKVRALRGYFGPLESKNLKVAFHQFHLIGLLEE